MTEIRPLVIDDSTGIIGNLSNTDTISPNILPNTAPPSGGLAGQYLTKLSNVDNDTGWVTQTYNGGWDLLKSLTILYAYTSGWTMLRTSTGILTGWVGYTGAGTAPTSGDRYNSPNLDLTTVATPKMTSNTAPAGVCSASSQYSTVYVPWKAFNRTNTSATTDCWLSVNGSGNTPQYLQYDFDTPTTIKAYAITNRYSTPYSVYDWSIATSDDATTWTTRQTIIGDDDNTANNTRGPYYLPDPVTARYWRLNMTRGSSNTAYGIGEFSLYNTGADPLASINCVSGTTNISAGPIPTKVNIAFTLHEQASGYYVLPDRNLPANLAATGLVKAHLSMNGGNTWTEFALSEFDPLTGPTKYRYFFSSMTPIPSGSQHRIKINVDKSLGAITIESWGSTWE